MVRHVRDVPNDHGGIHVARIVALGHATEYSDRLRSYCDGLTIAYNGWDTKQDPLECQTTTTTGGRIPRSI